MIFIIIWFDIASEEIELNANPFNPFFMSDKGEYSKYRELLKKKYYLRAYNFSDN